MTIDKPKLIPVPFARNGIKNNIIPSADTSNDTAANYDQGFPPRTLLNSAAGGLPPRGPDVNGILFEATSAISWMQSGGQATFDAAFAAATGGYPLNALLQSNGGSLTYRNRVDGNLTDPNNATTSTGWVIDTPLQATEDAIGLAAIATNEEIGSGQNNTKIVTPDGLKTYVDGAIGAAVPLATESVFGKLKIATNDEAEAGEDDTKALTSLKLKKILDRIGDIADATETTTGVIRIATEDEVGGGSNNASAVTPSKLQKKINDELSTILRPATEEVNGIISIATHEDVSEGVDDSSAITPDKLRVALEALEGGGVPVTTPPQFDTSDKIATTQFVKTSGLCYSKTSVVSNNKTLAPNDIGTSLLFGASNTLTVPEPSSFGARIGDSFSVSVISPGTSFLVRCAIVFSGCDYSFNQSGLVEPIYVLNGESITFIAEGPSSWRVVSSTAELGRSESFRSILSANGFKRIPDFSSPSGFFIHQWGGYYSLSGVAVSVPLPIAFPNGILSVQVVGIHDDNRDVINSYDVQFGSIPDSLSRFILRSDGLIDSVSFTAIGY